MSLLRPVRGYSSPAGIPCVPAVAFGKYSGGVADLGDLLELLHDASGAFESFRGEFRVWTNPRVAQSARTAWMERARRGSRVRRRSGSTFGGVIMAGDLVDRDELVESSEISARLWVQRPDRLREEEGEGEDMRLVVRDGGRWWSYDRLSGASTNEGEDEPGSSTVVGEYERMVDPVELLAVLCFEPLGRGVRAGRAVARAHAVPRVGPGLGRTALSLFGPGAEEYELDVDIERGVLLRVATRFGGEELAVVEAREVVFDQSISPEIFVFASPDGRPPKSEADEPSVQRVAIHEAARLAPFTVFALAGMPESWASFATFSSPNDRPVTPATVMLMYVAGDGGGTVIVNQQLSHDVSPARRARPADRQVTRDGLTIEIVELDGSFTMARVTRENTLIEITSADLDADQLIDLATRLQTAPTSPPAI